MTAELSYIDSWIFDLDNTLYPAACDLFALIDERMGTYVANLLEVDRTTAHRIQKGYFHEHGTTLSGLMAQHGVDPHHFLDYVHDIDMSRLSKDAQLRSAIQALEGRKIIFTNGDAAYAARVLSALGLDDCFEAIHDIHAMAYCPKPDPASYDGLCSVLDINPQSAIFFEDMARNLAPAKAMGMTTVWIDNGSEQANASACASFIDYRTDCVRGWLTQNHGKTT